MQKVSIVLRRMLMMLRNFDSERSKMLKWNVEIMSFDTAAAWRDVMLMRMHDLFATWRWVGWCPFRARCFIKAILLLPLFCFHLEAAYGVFELVAEFAEFTGSFQFIFSKKCSILFSPSKFLIGACLIKWLFIRNDPFYSKVKQKTTTAALC